MGGKGGQVRRQRGHGDANGRAIRRPDANNTLKPIFTTLWEMSKESHEHVLDGGPWDTPPKRLELAIFNGMINSLKAATQLLEGGHWEFASPIVRRLYELALNVEHLYSYVDRDAAVLRYVRFGMLQATLSQIDELEYRQDTGRVFDADRVDRLRAVTEDFGEFRLKDRADGTRRWRDTWCAKNTRDLAELSDHALRVPQYQMLYRGQWSEQSHGSPVTFLAGVFRTVTEHWMDDVLEADRFRIAQDAMLLQTLYLELWIMLDSIPEPDPDTMLRWSRAVSAAARRLNPEQWDAAVVGMSKPV